MSNIELGKLGEELATQYLKKLKYKIIARNFKKPFGEIDIIAKSKNGTLVFFEVKTTKETQIGPSSEDQMTFSKIKKLKKICNYFVLKNPNLINKNGWQIDVLAINIKNDNSYNINHYENIS